MFIHLFIKFASCNKTQQSSFITKHNKDQHKYIRTEYSLPTVLGVPNLKAWNE